MKAALLSSMPLSHLMRHLTRVMEQLTRISPSAIRRSVRMVLEAGTSRRLGGHPFAHMGRPGPSGDPIALLSKDPEAPRLFHGTPAIVDTELGIDVLAVSFDCTGRNKELLPDLPVAHALRKEREDF